MTETDREYLELAAKAAGIEGEWEEHPLFDGRDTSGIYVVGHTFLWNPIADDGDALRLAVTCGLVVDCSRPSAGEPYKQHAIWRDETMSNAELTRRAIVRAAAEIGKGMK
jgi:hypothetical protein